MLQNLSKLLLAGDRRPLPCHVIRWKLNSERKLDPTLRIDFNLEHSSWARGAMSALVNRLQSGRALLLFLRCPEMPVQRLLDSVSRFQRASLHEVTS